MGFYVESQVVRDELNKVIVMLLNNEYIVLKPEFVQQVLSNILQEEKLISE
jgi:hypothetical protein